MKISEKIYLDKDGLTEHGPITIVAFGDSVTHGAVSEGEINYETVYWNRLKQKINKVRAYMPVNVINAGIGGISAKTSLGRIEKQVLSQYAETRAQNEQIARNSLVLARKNADFNKIYLVRATLFI